MELRIGEQFDEFEVVEKIGSGSFSNVYLAHDTVLERMVVLKQLRHDLTGDDNEWAAFINEAQITASFFHPGLITVHGLRVNDHAPYAVLVLEYMDGGTLRDMIDDNGGLDLDLVWNLAFQVGNALNYLHRRGIVHRDIKPENILYSKETNWFKLTDFGLVYHPERPEFEEINDGQPGTLHYMSPEQSQDHEVDERSDQYTLASVLYEALSGAYYLPLDQDEEDQDIIFQHILNDLPNRLPPVHTDTVLVEKLEDVLLKALSKKPRKRYKSVSRFIRDFTRVIEYMESAQDALTSEETA